MFLATTALSDFWDKSSNILFLGEWCLRYDKRNEWDGLSYKVLQYPWDDRDEMYSANLYCTQIYEAILPDISAWLNQLHGVSFSLRYWRIVIGEWLWRYIQILYDRYTCLKNSMENYNDITTILLNVKDYRYVVNNLEFIQFCTSDIYNLQIYSQILRGFGLKFPSKPYVTCLKKLKVVESLKFNKKGLYKILTHFLFILPPSPQVVFCHTQKVPIKWLYKLILRSLLKYRELFFLEDENIVQKLTPNRALRKTFLEFDSVEPFQNVCLKIMEYSFPMVFIEGFKELRMKAMRYTRKVPKVILSTAAWRTNTTSGIYIAENVERGAKLIGIQHGGGYGITKMDPISDHELEVTDNFISWGWTDNKKIIPLAAPFLSEKGKKHISYKKKSFIYVGNNVSRYLSCFQSLPGGPKFENYLSWQERFFLSLKHEIIKLFLVRLYPVETGWFNKLRLQDTVQGLRYDDFIVPFLKRAKESNLAVVDSNQTTFLETIGLDIPTIIFWDKSVWEIQDSAKSYFEELKEAKVFHDSPESAANFVNNYYAIIEEWWNNERVKQAVKRFKDNYALSSKNCVSDWDRFIQQFIREN